MKNSKGISMISLIITVIVTILLASMALSTGTRYLKDSKNKEKENFIQILSSAVSKRQEDVSVNSLAYPYLGYYIHNDIIFESVFAPKVQGDLKYENSIWYVVDNASATNLGVKEIGDYIDSIDTASAGEEIKVALVDYKSGAVHLINVSTHELNGLEVSDSDFITGHTHRFVESESTCTTGVKCEDCGFILKEPLGHLYESALVSSYDNESHYTKKCARPECEMVGGFALHDLEVNYEKRDNVWYHTIHCLVCDYEKVHEPCIIQYYLPDTVEGREAEHIRYCAVCSHSENEAHAISYRRISESVHEKYCTIPACNYTIERQNHIDENNDKSCDLCTAEIIDYSYPQLVRVEMVNSTAAENGGRYYAKYGDTITMEIEADKKIQNLKVTIAGVTIPSTAMSTVDQQTWTVTFYIDPTLHIADGKMKITIDCESITGVTMPSTFIATTDGNAIVFDGTNPIVQYINKLLRIGEI